MKRRGLFIALSILLAAVTVAGILYNPSIDRMQAIPAHARVIYSKESSDRLSSVFPSLERVETSRFSGWSKAAQWLKNRPLSIATVPLAGREQRDTVVAVCKLGGPAATALRWRLAFSAPEGVSPARPYAVWSVWRVEHPSFPSWARVRFAITEGLLICSVSSDSHDIYHLLDVADGRAASLSKR